MCVCLCLCVCLCVCVCVLVFVRIPMAGFYGPALPLGYAQPHIRFHPAFPMMPVVPVAYRQQQLVRSEHPAAAAAALPPGIPGLGPAGWYSQLLAISSSRPQTPLTAGLRATMAPFPSIVLSADGVDETSSTALVLENARPDLPVTVRVALLA